MVNHEGDVCVFRTVSDGADQVFLVGDFNDWSTTAHPMESSGDGVWRAALRLRPGTYRFAYFVVHGQSAWARDPREGLTALRIDPGTRAVHVPQHSGQLAAAC